MGGERVVLTPRVASPRFGKINIFGGKKKRFSASTGFKSLSQIKGN
jgi:flagellar biosynthesis protein FlhB